MEKFLSVKSNLDTRLKFLLVSLLGSGLIALSALIKIPFYPISFTLQSMMVFILALTQSPKQAFGSVICYLILATCGLPVLSGGGANALWLLSKGGGYLLAFPISAYLTAKLSQRIPALLAVLAGQTLIYALGMLWLIPFFGFKIALFNGVLFFIPSDFLKNLIAVGTFKVWKTRHA